MAAPLPFATSPQARKSPAIMASFSRTSPASIWRRWTVEALPGAALGFLIAVSAISGGHPSLILLSAATIRGAIRRGGIPAMADCLTISNPKTGLPVQVLVRDNNVDQALRALKK